MRMKLKQYIFLLTGGALFLLISCNSNKESKALLGSLNYNVKEVCIPVDSARLSSYKPFSIYESKTDTIFIGYNKHLHALDLFSLPKEKFLYSIFLNKDGPNAVKRLKDILPFDLDSILVFEEHELCFINRKGVKIWKRGINMSIYDKSFDTLRLYAETKFKAVIGSSPNILQLEVYDFTNSFKSRAFYFGNLEAEFNIETGSLRLLNISYPIEYKHKNGNFGHLNFPSRITIGDTTIYGFPVIPRLVVLLPNGEKREVQIKSKFHSSDAELLPRKETDPIRLMAHMISSPIYDNLVYDPYRELIYCFFLAPIPYKIKDNTFNSFGDKPLSILVLDKNFNLLDEWVLSQKTYTNQLAFVTSRGLYILKGHYKYQGLSADTLKFDVFTITY